MIDLSNTDHNAMDQYLNKLLDDYNGGKVNRLDARCDLAHAITLAAKDQNLMAYIRVCLEKD